MNDLITVGGHALGSLAFGTMQWGGTADAAASAALFDACRDAGIRHFDTAVAYTDGHSERLLGQLVKRCRDEVFVATKVGYTGGAGRRNILDQFERSQKQLNLDRVDLLYLHRFDSETPLDETFETMARLQAEGRIRHIGVSNYAAWQVMKAQSVCHRLGTKIDAVQPMYSLVKRQVEAEILPMAADQGIAPFTYSPLGGGLLTGKYRHSTVGRLVEDDRYAARYAPKSMHDAAANLAELADETGHDPATLAVAWVMAQRVTPIISARSTAQLAPSLAAASLALPKQTLSALSNVFPAPPPATDRLEEG